MKNKDATLPPALMPSTSGMQSVSEPTSPLGLRRSLSNVQRSLVVGLRGGSYSTERGTNFSFAGAAAQLKEKYDKLKSAAFPTSNGNGTLPLGTDSARKAAIGAFLDSAATGGKDAQLKAIEHLCGILEITEQIFNAESVRQQMQQQIAIPQSSLAVSVAEGDENTSPCPSGSVDYTTRAELVKDDEEGLETLNNLHILQDAGAGRHGRVKIAYVEPSGEMRAVKILSKKLLRAQWLATLPPRERLQQQASSKMGNNITALNPALLNEVTVMKKIHHRNIVKLYEVIDDPECDKVYLVMQYVERGPIVRFDDTNRCPPISISVLKTYMRQLIGAVGYLHSQGIVHRDIKPDNILLGANGLVYLSDFGVSSIFGAAQGISVTVGTPAFMAPETFSEAISLASSGGIGSAETVGESESMHSSPTPPQSVPEGAPPVDVWALGITFYVMLFGYFPFDISFSFAELREQILTTEFDFTIPSSVFEASNNETGIFIEELDISAPSDLDLAVDLLKKMLDRNPVTRITMTEAKRHKFVATRNRAISGAIPPSDSGAPAVRAASAMALSPTAITAADAPPPKNPSTKTPPPAPTNTFQKPSPPSLSSSLTPPFPMKREKSSDSDTLDAPPSSQAISTVRRKTFTRKDSNLVSFLMDLNQSSAAVSHAATPEISASNSPLLKRGRDRVVTVVPAFEQIREETPPEKLHL